MSKCQITWLGRQTTTFKAKICAMSQHLAQRRRSIKNLGPTSKSSSCINECRLQHQPYNTLKLEIISTQLRRIGIPPPTAPPGESLCIKTGNQIGGWVYSRFDHVIHGGPKYTNFLASGRGMSVD